MEWYGEPIKDVDKAFRRTVEDARLGEGVSPHTLRHTAATWLMQRSTGPGEAISFLGMTVQTFERVYWHHHPDFQSDAAAKIASTHTTEPKPKAAVNVIRSPKSTLRDLRFLRFLSV